MKKLIVCAGTLLCFAIAHANSGEVNARVLKSFNQAFAGARNLNWSESENQYTASFMLGETRCRVNFDQKGNMLSSFRYFNPNLLPVNLANSIRQEFPGKTLFGVTEITVGKDLAYIVKMFDHSHWYTLRLNPTGECEILEILIRADKDL